jgi:DNA-3-methyladenine glycosylase
MLHSHMHDPTLLLREALPADTVTMARFLIGKWVMRELPEGLAGGQIVETEAYLTGDAASHAYRGMTPRNGTMFLERGHAYVYLAYGTSFMLNITSQVVGVGEAVLIRALEPLIGIGLMEARRGTLNLRDLARGPGRLAQALQIDRNLDGADMCRPGPLWLGVAGGEPQDIGVSTRIGITKDADRPLRFYLRASPFVSGARTLNL